MNLPISVLMGYLLHFLVVIPFPHCNRLLSKLDDIGTSLRLFELFFDHALVIAGYTYSYREEAHTSFFA